MVCERRSDITNELVAGVATEDVNITMQRY